jgi:hypothetical protein
MKIKSISLATLFRSVMLFTVALVIVGLSGTLVHRAEASRSAAAVMAGSFTGKTWQTTWTTTDGRIVSAPVEVRADTGTRNALDGSVEVNGPDGAMYGTLSSDGNTWTGTWWNPDHIHGTFTFTLRGNNNFSGSYTVTGTDGSFDWHGTR